MTDPDGAGRPPLPPAPTALIDPLLRAAEALRAQGRQAEAIAAFRALLALAPHDWRIHGGLAVAQFYAGDWDAAWTTYEIRFQLMGKLPPAERAGADGRIEALPRWREGPAPDDLVVRAEQGLGDCIQFARYLPRLRAPGRRLRLQLDPRLHRLLRPLTAGYELLDLQHRPASLAGCEAWVSMLDLPRLLGLVPGQPVVDAPYLPAEFERVAQWRQRLQAIGPGYRVGLAWQGNPKAPIDPLRSAPLSALLPLSHVPGVRLVSLQKSPGDEQIAQVPFGAAIHTLGPDFDAGPDAFVDTAAVLANLDLLVTVDTSLAHVAGALGVPTLLLLHEVHTDWRWLQGRDDTVWYRSVRLIRCERQADWITAAAKAAAILRARLSTGPAPLLPPPGPVAERRERGAAASPGIVAALPLVEALDLMAALAAAADGSADTATRAGLHRRLDELQRAVSTAGLGTEVHGLVLALRDVHAAILKAEAALRTAPDAAARAAAAARLIELQDRRASLLRPAATLTWDAAAPAR